ncbi:MAG: hypothetical protein ACOYXM_15075 [Actinomycetota bacterium]
MRTRSAIRLAAAAVSTIAASLVATTTEAGASPQHPSPTASCVATVTVAETLIAPGFVGDEVKGIVQLGVGTLPSLVRSLADAHLGDLDGCAALVGE